MKTNKKERTRLHYQELDRITKIKIQNSMIWSMNTWGGDRCSACGLEVRPCVQQNWSNTWLDDNGKWVGHITANGPACASDLFEELGYVCPGENMNWMEEVAAQHQDEEE
jgi:hypothetical protein